ncbi:MAG: hypothetical protein Q9225_004793 [Loekoesia sp. 1 TL-2023]
MASAQLTCRIRVNKAENYDADAEGPENSAVFDLKDCPEVGIEVRTRWTSQVVEYFKTTHDSIRPWDFIGKSDGSIELLPLSAPEGGVYPARFRIPPETIRELDHHDKVRRAEKFAMASLLYEIFSGKKPFEELTDEEVQHRFSNAIFPEDAISLPNSVLIYSGWSEEFSLELNKQVQDASYLQRIKNYAKANPIRTGIQAVGLTLSAVSFLAVPVLGAVGFTAAGPAAGSAAAAWQASIGAVEAGSLFAWCQSAAMGGAALGGIQFAGIAGAAITRMVENHPNVAKFVKNELRARVSEDGIPLVMGLHSSRLSNQILASLAVYLPGVDGGDIWDIHNGNLYLAVVGERLEA